jgi:hypothetical protein
LQRFPRAASVDERRECRSRVVREPVAADGGRLDPAPRGREDVGDEEFGIHLGVGDTRGGETRDGVADDIGDGRQGRVYGLGHDGSRA